MSHLFLGCFQTSRSKGVTRAHTSDHETKQTQTQSPALREGGARCSLGGAGGTTGSEREECTEEESSGPLGCKGIVQAEPEEGQWIHYSTCCLCWAQAPPLSEVSVLSLNHQQS